MAAKSDIHWQISKYYIKPLTHSKHAKTKPRFACHLDIQPRKGKAYYCSWNPLVAQKKHAEKYWGTLPENLIHGSLFHAKHFANFLKIYSQSNPDNRRYLDKN